MSVPCGVVCVTVAGEGGRARHGGGLLGRSRRPRGGRTGEDLSGCESNDYESPSRYCLARYYNAFACGILLSSASLRLTGSFCGSLCGVYLKN